MYTPNSSIRLLSTDLTLGDENTLVFNSKEEQADYFMQQGSYYWGADNFTFIKDGVLRVNGNVNDFYKYNYLMYKNTKFTDKWFYAYITNIEYLNEQVTLIYYQLDVIQTWYFDYQIKKSYVDRQHLLNDTYSSVPDTVATGKLVQIGKWEINYTGSYFVFLTNDVTKDDTSSLETLSFVCGRYTCPCQVVYFPATPDGARDLNNFIQSVSNRGRADRILSCVFIPFLNSSMLNMETTEKTGTDVGDFTVVNSITFNSEQMTLSFTPNSIVGLEYAKMRTMPYSEIRVTDMTTGQYIQLDFAKFNLFSQDNTCKFRLQCTISPNPTIRVIPMNYCGQLFAYDNALVINCNTVMTTINNQYANYMMRNGNINNLNKEFAKGERSLATQGAQLSRNQAIVGGGMSALGSLASRDIGGAIRSGVGMYNANQNFNQQKQEINYSAYEKIASISAQEDSAGKMASQMTDISDGAMNRLVYENGLLFTEFSLDNYYKKNVTNFWKMYGYPVHELTEVNHRVPNQNWCYCKVVSPNIVGRGIPQNDLTEIAGLYEKGLTWWDKDHFKEYD